MSSKKTTHYQLHQWESEDHFLRREFNENFAGVDTALHGMVVTGAYDGDGATERFISLGFTPRAVFICTSEGRVAVVSSSLYVQGGLAIPGHPLMVEKKAVLEIAPNGFTAYQRGYLKGVNENTYTYYYWALR